MPGGAEVKPSPSTSADGVVCFDVDVEDILPFTILYDRTGPHAPVFADSRTRSPCEPSSASTFIMMTIKIWIVMKHHILDMKELGTVVAVCDLVVLKTKGEMILRQSEGCEEILQNTDLEDEDTVDVVPECVEVGSLGLSDDQILLVQIGIRASHIFTVPETFLNRYP